MKIVLALVLTLANAIAFADDVKTSPWSLGLTFDTYTNRDESSRFATTHDDYRRIDGWSTEITAGLGYKLTDKDSLKVSNTQIWENRRGENNEKGTWLYSSAQYSRSKILEQDKQFINMSGLVRLYDYVNKSSDWTRGIRDTTPYSVRTALSFSKDWTSWFSLSLDPYFQWYVRETGASGTSKWKVAYTLAPSFTLTDKLSVNLPLNYYYTRKISLPKNNKVSPERTIEWEWVPSVAYQWTSSFSTEAYYQVYPLASSADNKTGTTRKVWKEHTYYGLVLDFKVF